MKISFGLNVFKEMKSFCLYPQTDFVSITDFFDYEDEDDFSKTGLLTSKRETRNPQPATQNVEPRTRLAHLNGNIIPMLPTLEQQHHGIFLAIFNDGLLKVLDIFDGIVIHLKDYISGTRADIPQLGSLVNI